MSKAGSDTSQKAIFELKVFCHFVPHHNYLLLYIGLSFEITMKYMGVIVKCKKKR